jgi:hypothetical protein
MSVLIGHINPKANPIEADVHVYASRAGVELHVEPNLTLDPTQARNLAALIERAADEAGRLRALPELP